MSKRTEYAYSHNAEEFYAYHESRDEAIREGSEYAEEDQYYIYTGRIVNPNLSIDVDWILERLGDLAYDLTGGASSDYGFLDGVTAEEEKELEIKLNKVLKEWLDKYHMVNFYTVDKISRHEIKGDSND